MPGGAKQVTLPAAGPGAALQSVRNTTDPMHTHKPMYAHKHEHDLVPWQHAHDFATDRRATERRAWIVVAITVVMMAAEIAAGWWWNSMALLADGWHMGTHAVAIGVTGISYWLVRRWSRDARFSLGPWKVEVLGAYTSAILLAVVAAGVTAESIVRLYRPEPVGYEESLVVAVIGLIVNLVCARLLHAGDGHAHGEGHGHAHVHAHVHAHDHAHAHAQAHAQAHAHRHEHDHAPAAGQAAPHPHPHVGAPSAPPAAAKDLNREAAYTHVLADAATSVLAIGALVAGKWMGWLALDPIVGLVGAALIAWWARGLIMQSSTILLDREMDHPLATALRQRLESDGDAKVADLHLWRVGSDAFACAVTLVADAPASADAYRARLDGLAGLEHVTLEINRCRSSAQGSGAST